jgi:hypothetical protein
MPGRAVGTIAPMDQAGILRDYRELRRVSMALAHRMAKMLDGEEIRAAARSLGVLNGEHVDIEPEDELTAVADYAVFNLFRSGRNAVDRLLEEDPPPEGSTELRLLRLMQESHYTIFEVEKAIPGFGVRGFDGPERIPIVLVDLGFSATAAPGALLATRICSPGEGWWMSTGAALPINREALAQVIQETEDHQRRNGEKPSVQEQTTMLIGACVASGAARQIRYVDTRTGLDPRTSQMKRLSPKIGRNDPCPCGSGKKYKKCCAG